MKPILFFTLKTMIRNNNNNNNKNDNNNTTTTTTTTKTTIAITPKQKQKQQKFVLLPFFFLFVLRLIRKTEKSNTFSHALIYAGFIIIAAVDYAVIVCTL